MVQKRGLSMVQKGGLSRVQAVPYSCLFFSELFSEKGHLDGTTRFPKKFLRLDVWLKFSLNPPTPLAKYYANTGVSKKRHFSFLLIKPYFFVNILDLNFTLIPLVPFLSAFSKIKVPQSSVKVSDTRIRSALVFVFKPYLSYYY